MCAAIGGVNTHKGTIFTLGLLCAAAGRCESTDPTQICTQVAAMTAGITKLEFVGNEQTVGESCMQYTALPEPVDRQRPVFPHLLKWAFLNWKKDYPVVSLWEKILSPVKKL